MRHPLSSCLHPIQSACIASVPYVICICMKCTPVSILPSWWLQIINKSKISASPNVVYNLSVETHSWLSCGRLAWFDLRNPFASSHNVFFLVRKGKPFLSCIGSPCVVCNRSSTSFSSFAIDHKMMSSQVLTSHNHRHVVQSRVYNSILHRNRTNASFYIPFVIISTCHLIKFWLSHPSHACIADLHCTILTYASCRSCPCNTSFSSLVH